MNDKNVKNVIVDQGTMLESGPNSLLCRAIRPQDSLDRHYYKRSSSLYADSEFAREARSRRIEPERNGYDEVQADQDETL